MRPLLAFAALTLSTTFLHAQKTAPKVLQPSMPGYPEELVDTGTNGVAEVDVVVKADGTVSDPRLGMATHRAFGRAAMNAVNSWRFEAGTENGQPVDQKVTIPFKFTAPFDQTVNALAKRKVFVQLSEPALTDKDFPTKKLKVKKAARTVYPRSLIGSGATEKVQVKFVVAPDGSTLNPVVVSPPKHKEFEPAAIQAVALMS